QIWSVRLIFIAIYWVLKSLRCMETKLLLYPPMHMVHHIGLNTWHSENSPRATKEGVGLYHTAILYPIRKDLAVVFERLLKHEYPLTGVSDHGVSEAIYLDDPDGNGVELYWDRPKEEWPLDENGNIAMYTISLDVEGLLAELN